MVGKKSKQFQYLSKLMTTKRHNIDFLFLMGSIFLFASCVSSRSVSHKKYIPIPDLLQKKEFTLEAHNANAGNSFYSKELLHKYTLTLSADSVIAWLPYYDRSYRSPANPSKIVVRFISTDFSYRQTGNIKDGWTITLTPHDLGNEITKMIILVTESGYASLQLKGKHWQNITFYGKINTRKKLP